MIYEQIKQDRIQAMKAKSPSKDILTVLVGEIERLKGKEEITDQRVTALLKKLKADTEQARDAFHYKEQAQFEIDVISQYIPKQLTEVEIAHIIALNQLDSMKEAQAFMKENYAGLYDGKTVASLFKK